MIAFAVAKNELGAAYVSLWPRIASGIGPHLVDSDIVLYADRCDASIYREGDFFRQAMWEVINDANCSKGTCTTYGIGGPIFLSGSPVTRTLQVLAYALDRLGPDITFAQLVNKMAEDLSYSEREQFRDVFRYHGLGV